MVLGCENSVKKCLHYTPGVCIFSSGSSNFYSQSLLRFAFVPPGTFVGMVDPTNAVRESDETNNLVTKAYVVAVPRGMSTDYTT